MRRFRYLYFLLLIPFALAFQGCEAIPKDALKMNPQTLEDRQLQTRVFNTSDESRILSASASVLQDLGFNLDESQTNLGLLVASFDRDARETGQVIRAIAWWLMLGVVADARYDYKQEIRASVVTSRVAENRTSTAVHITFQRIVWDQTNKISKVEHFNGHEIYQEFFQKLSKALLLETHRI